MKILLARKPGPVQPTHHFVTVRQFAEREKISVRHVHRLIKDGKLTVHRIGRAIRISMTDIALFEARCRQSL